MYNNIGGKIKAIAAIAGWICLILGIIACIIFWVTDEDLILTGLVSLIFGIAGLVSSWFLYGFGQLVDDVERIRALLLSTRYSEQPRKNTQKTEKVSEITAATTKATMLDDGWICGHCQTKNSINYGQCKKCGKFRG